MAFAAPLVGMAGKALVGGLVRGAMGGISKGISNKFGGAPQMPDYGAIRAMVPGTVATPIQPGYLNITDWRPYNAGYLSQKTMDNWQFALPGAFNFADQFTNYNVRQNEQLLDRMAPGSREMTQSMRDAIQQGIETGMSPAEARLAYSTASNAMGGRGIGGGMGQSMINLAMQAGQRDAVQKWMALGQQQAGQDRALAQSMAVSPMAMMQNLAGSWGQIGNLEQGKMQTQLNLDDRNTNAFQSFRQQAENKRAKEAEMMMRLKMMEEGMDAGMVQQTFGQSVMGGALQGAMGGLGGMFGGGFGGGGFGGGFGGYEGSIFRGGSAMPGRGGISSWGFGGGPFASAFPVGGGFGGGGGGGGLLRGIGRAIFGRR